MPGGKNMKKILTLILLSALLCAALSLSVFADDTQIQPRSNNYMVANASFTISSTGNASVTVRYIGYASVFDGAKITSKIQKNESGTWVDVNNGQPDNTWTDTSTLVSFNTTHTHQLTERGTYRAVVNFEIWGRGGATDCVEKIVEYVY